MGYLMKTTSILLVALLVLVMMFGFVGCQPTDEPAGSSSDNGPADPITFTFMTYNVRVQVSNDADKRVPYDTVKDRAPLILQHIADADPDVLCIQEWTGNHTMEVAPSLEEQYEILVFQRGDFFESCAILYKKDRFELISTEHFWLSETPEEPSKSWDADYPRIYASALLRDKLSNKTFRAGTTHLDLATVARGKQRKMVVDHTANSAEPAIVCGDFNFDARHDLYLYCINTLNDCRTLVTNATTTASYNGYNVDGQILDADGAVKNGYGYPIDQIFVKRDAFTVHSYSVLNYLIDGKFSSDHFPIVVELSIND